MHASFQSCNRGDQLATLDGTERCLQLRCAAQDLPVRGGHEVLEKESCSGWHTCVTVLPGPSPLPGCHLACSPLLPALPAAHACPSVDYYNNAMHAARFIGGTLLCEQCCSAIGACVSLSWKEDPCLEDEAWSVDDCEVGAVCILCPQHNWLCRHSTCTHSQPESQHAALH